MRLAIRTRFRLALSRASVSQYPSAHVHTQTSSPPPPQSPPLGRPLPLARLRWVPDGQEVDVVGLVVFAGRRIRRRSGPGLAGSRVSESRWLLLSDPSVDDGGTLVPFELYTCSQPDVFRSVGVGDVVRERLIGLFCSLIALFVFTLGWPRLRPCPAQRPPAPAPLHTHTHTRARVCSPFFTSMLLLCFAPLACCVCSCLRHGAWCGRLSSRREACATCASPPR